MGFQWACVRFDKEGTYAFLFTGNLDVYGISWWRAEIFAEMEE